MQVKAEQWIVGSGATVQPVDQWAEWVIDPNSLRGPGGVGTADEGDLHGYPLYPDRHRQR